jgi:hypothetical protein
MFLMVGSCVITMNIINVGSCVNNIHFIYLFSHCNNILSTRALEMISHQHA